MRAFPKLFSKNPKGMTLLDHPTAREKKRREWERMMADQFLKNVEELRAVIVERETGVKVAGGRLPLSEPLPPKKVKQEF